jgi:hypothetical protein
MENDVIVAGAAAVPLVVALVAATGEAAPSLPRRMYPVLAIVLGVAWSSLAALAMREWSWLAPLAGVVIGLSASGLYSAAVKPAAEAMGRRR